MNYYYLKSPGILIILSLILSLASCSQTERSEAPNFLIIFTDDQGYDDLTCHGNPHLETPHIDQLARESVEFTHFHAAPLCAPSRAALLTGRNFLRTGVWGVHGGQDYLNLDETTFADILQEHGYATGMMGKWHSGHPDAWRPWSRGFDESWAVKLYKHDDCLMQTEEGWVNPGGWATDTLTQLAIDFMDRHREGPFLCYLPYMVPHGLWRAPESFVEKYLDMGLSLELATVYAMIDHMDHNVGKALDYLDESGLAANTVVIFMTDNGPVQATHGGPPNHMSDGDWQRRNPSKLRGSKGTVWENGTRVPCFIRWQDRFEAGVVDRNASLEDIFPTLLELAGIPVPAGNKPLDGRSLAPLLEGHGNLWSDRLLFIPKDEPYWPGKPNRYSSIMPSKDSITYKLQNLTVRNQEFKLVKTGEQYQLFNIMEDPQETRNLAGHHPEVVDSLKKALRHWYEEILADPASYTYPRFLIGEEGRDSTYLYACASASVSGNVQGGSHWTSGWKEEGDAQTLLVRVLESGSYSLALEIRDPRPGARVEIRLGEQVLSAMVGKDKMVEVGELSLEAGDYEMYIALGNPGEAKGPAFSGLVGIICKKQAS